MFIIARICYSCQYFIKISAAVLRIKTAKSENTFIEKRENADESFLHIMQ